MIRQPHLLEMPSSAHRVHEDGVHRSPNLMNLRWGVCSSDRERGHANGYEGPKELFMLFDVASTGEVCARFLPSAMVRLGAMVGVSSLRTQALRCSCSGGSSAPLRKIRAAPQRLQTAVLVGLPCGAIIQWCGQGFPDWVFGIAAILCMTPYAPLSTASLSPRSPLNRGPWTIRRAKGSASSERRWIWSVARSMSHPIGVGAHSRNEPHLFRDGDECYV